MVRVEFTPNLKRHIECPSITVEGATVRQVLDAAFDANPKARGYVLDDQGALRKHMAVFVSGELIKDRVTLSDAVPPGAEVFVMQALSGG